MSTNHVTGFHDSIQIFFAQLLPIVPQIQI